MKTPHASSGKCTLYITSEQLGKRLGVAKADGL